MPRHVTNAQGFLVNSQANIHHLALDIIEQKTQFVKLLSSKQEVVELLLCLPLHPTPLNSQVTGFELLICKVNHSHAFYTIQKKGYTNYHVAYTLKLPLIQADEVSWLLNFLMVELIDYLNQHSFYQFPC